MARARCPMVPTAPVPLARAATREPWPEADRVVVERLGELHAGVEALCRTPTHVGAVIASLHALDTDDIPFQASAGTFGPSTRQDRLALPYVRAPM